MNITCEIFRTSKQGLRTYGEARAEFAQLREDWHGTGARGAAEARLVEQLPAGNSDVVSEVDRLGREVAELNRLIHEQGFSAFRHQRNVFDALLGHSQQLMDASNRQASLLRSIEERVTAP